MTQYKLILEARKAGRVKRFHTTDLLFQETVAEHTFNVMNILSVICGGNLSLNLLRHALAHDMGEYKTGDIPANVKRDLPLDARELLKFKEQLAVIDIHPFIDPEHNLADEDRWLLEFADNLDGLMKCTDELRRGNRGVIDIGNRYIEYLQAMTDDVEVCCVLVADAVFAFRELAK